jgi:hypothetical protein
MNNKHLVVAVLSVVIASAGLLEARGPRQGGGQGHPGKHGFGHKVGKKMIKFMRNKLSDKLDLSSDQEKKVEVILNAQGEKMKALMEETRKKSEVIRDEGAVEIRALLDKEQAVKFDRLKDRMERRRAERREKWLGKIADEGAKD